MQSKEQKAAEKWVYDASSPEPCSASGCSEDMNGLWYAKVRLARDVVVWLGFCKKHAKRLGWKEKKVRP